MTLVQIAPLSRAEYRAACHVRDETARDLFYIEQEGEPTAEVVATLRRQLAVLAAAIEEYESRARWRRVFFRPAAAAAASTTRFAEAIRCFSSDLDRLRRAGAEDASD